MREYDKVITTYFERALFVLFFFIATVTILVLVIIAWNYPLDEEYTINHRLSFVLLSVAGYCALLFR